MAVDLNLADLLFLQTQVIAGSQPPAGTDPLSLLGLRAVDGTNNNLTHQLLVDQYGNLVSTDTYALADQPFFAIASTSGPNSYDLGVSYTNFDMLRGGTGGTMGDDTILGTTGDDFINGGLGNDTITGNGGADTIVFDTTLNAATNVDTITDFVADGSVAGGDDKISLGSNIFTQLSASLTGGALGTNEFLAGAGLTQAGNVDHRIIYNTTDGTLYYDADGAGGNASVAFAVLDGTPPPTVDAGDFIVESRLADTSPRVISNLVADSSATNPAFVAAEASANPATGNPGFLSLNVAPVNSLFTFFGQFFDHGLDFIDKGGSGTIEIALLPGDPLFDQAPMNSMFVDRATLDPVTGETNNSTAPLVEQSQTYGQRATTTFYLMEYDDAGNATGRLVTHADGGMATWQDIKDNAAKVGLTLLDEHVLDIPEAVWNPAANGGLGGYELGAVTGQALLADIAHTANPANPGYDAALLAAHKVAGDGRVNENTALTSIHSAFHGEHNRIVLEIEDLIAQQEQLTPGFSLQWDGERIFEAAKLVNEMQYQHFVFEEFGRRMSPNIDAFAQYDVNLNPNISAEFSQAVYRLGHSQLTDDVISQDASGSISTMSLVEAFLNPNAFDATGAAALIKGQTLQQMNEVDEFVVGSLRNMLLGLPLDLAAINIARGRDLGLPTLNELRAELFAQTGILQEYSSWTDFGDNLLHPESLVNFIAAYANDTGIAAAREAGNNDLARSLATTAAADVTGFMSSTGDQGFWNIDLWLGGLAEAKAFGPTGAPPSLLGETFDFIFAQQMLSLQNGDRFYYLARLGGTNILAEIEQSTFGDLFERGTGARHTNGNIFSAFDEQVELSDLGKNTFSNTNAQTTMQVIGGTTLADTISAGGGNDTVWGEDGDDTISGGDGADHLFGNAGDDTISGGNNNDFIRGDAGNDTLSGDQGDDLIFGKAGDDILRGGADFDILEGGRGNDILDGGSQDDTLIGQENDDILLGGFGNDAVEGDSGNDFLSGGADADTLLGLEGDDVLDGGAGADVLDGGLGGYDVASYQNGGTFDPITGDPVGLTIEMFVGGASTGEAAGDTYIDIEEVRGTPFDDGIIGDALDNVLVGNGGSDFLDGGLGNDVLYDNAGMDDTLIGGGGVDQVVFLGRASTDFINPFTSINSIGDGTLVEVGGVGSDTLTGIAELAFDDGIWSTALGEWVPLVGLESPTGVPEPTLTVKGVDPSDPTLTPVFFELDGNQVNSTVVMDNTPIDPINGIYVADIVITDPDGISGGPSAGRAVTLAGPDAAAFAISPDGTELRFVGSAALGAKTVNFEFQERYHVTVNVADASGGSAMNYTLNITDANDNAPVFTSPDQIHLNVNSVTDKVIYRATASDKDTVTNIEAGAVVPDAVPGSELLYGLAAYDADPLLGNNNNLFVMENGEIKFDPLGEAPAIGNYTLELTASDGVQTTAKTVEVNVEALGLLNITDTFTSSMMVSQTSQYGSGDYGSANNVLDNDAGTFNHTQNGTNESLTLDLGAAFDVSSVRILNCDGAGARLDGATVTLVDETGAVIETLGTIGGAENGETFDFSTLTGATVTASAVQVSLNNEYLHIAELDVFGYVPTDAPINLTDQYGASMAATQTSQYGSGDYGSANNVLDNDAGTFNHTQNGTSESLTLDLGAAFGVTSVRILNRDGAGARLDGATVTLVDDLGAVIETVGTVAAAEDGEMFSFSTASGAPVSASGVQVSLNNEYLHIAELDVFGFAS